VTTGIVCINSPDGCQGIATPQHPECSGCQRERKLAALRETPSITAHLLAWIIDHTPRHDLELEAGG
jgi:hypothetical protein